MIVVYILIALIVLLLIRASMLGNDMKIERSIVIKRNTQDIFDYVKLLRNHRYFNKWTMTDPNVDIVYTGTDAEIGFSSKWKSNIKSVGEGSQTIAGINAPNRVDYTLQFIKPFEDTAGAYVNIENIDAESCKVYWGFTGKRKFMQKVMQVVLNLEKMLGNDLQISLENLKLILEK